MANKKPMSYEDFFEIFRSISKSKETATIGAVSKTILLEYLISKGVHKNLWWEVLLKTELILRVENSYKFYINLVGLSEERIQNAHKALYPSLYKRDTPRTAVQIIAQQKTMSDFLDSELLKELERRGYIPHKKMEGKRWIAVPAPSSTTVVKIITETIVGK